MKVEAGFSWFGNKERVAERVWAAFGDDIALYIEPFCGSAAVLFGRPRVQGYETLNDADGFVTNFFRAASRDPTALAQAIDWPVNEADLVARHQWLLAQRRGLTKKLERDPDFADVRAAAYWGWGLSCWIGDGFAEEFQRKIPNVDGYGGKGFVGMRRESLDAHFQRLHARLRGVRVACGDWQRVVAPTPLRSHGTRAVFFDPPYAKGNARYAVGGAGVVLSKAVEAWCAAHDQDDALRLVLCGRGDEHDALLARGWWRETWSAKNGFAREGNVTRHDEALWFSPQCLAERQLGLAFGATP